MIASAHIDPATYSELLPAWRCSNEKYLGLIESGVLGTSDKVELIRGLISAMTPAGPDHSSVIGIIPTLFKDLLSDYRLLIQGTVRISEGNILDPDITVLKPHTNAYYRKKHAGPDDILLIVEVSNSSIRRDREVKTGIYAAAGIAEYWIADLNTKTMIVQRQPKGEVYEQVTTHGLDAEIDTVNLGDFKLKVGDVFG